MSSFSNSSLEQSSNTTDSDNDEVIEESAMEESGVNQSSTVISESESDEEAEDSDKSSQSDAEHSSRSITKFLSDEAKSTNESVSYTETDEENDVVQSDAELDKAEKSFTTLSIDEGHSSHKISEKSQKSIDNSNASKNTTLDTDTDTPIRTKRRVKKIWNIDSDEESPPSHRVVNSIRFDRTKNSFDESITNKLSSTVSDDYSQSKDLQTTESQNNEKTIDSNKLNESTSQSIPLDNSIEIVSADPVMISILSAPSNVGNEFTPNLSSPKHNSPVLQSSTPMSSIQKKITEYIKPSPSLSQKQRERRDDISLTFITEQEQKLEKMKEELQTCRKVLDTFGSKLPDNGKRMQDRIENLKDEINKKTEYISKLLKTETEASNSLDNRSNDSPSWPTIPKTIGENVISNDINVATAVTLDCLKEICGSLETCPGEEVLADEPKGLKVTLMTHQRHALAWMNWRESQKPRGGILADDMGLGKTLTMISLILDVKQKKERLDEDEDDRPKKRRRGGTLVVCPASLIGQWKNEIENRLKPNLLSVSLHHGNNRETKPRYLCRYDVIVTTYGIVSREFKTDGALFDIKWDRIILDEAHVIRNHKSQSSESCCGLRGKHRWVLTGTPIQNKEMDVFALLKFLRCTPFDELANWKRWINKSAGGQQRLNMIMKSLLLRRTKLDLIQKKEVNSLPEKKCEVIEFDLEKEEMNVYQKILAFSQTLFAQFLNQHKERSDAFATGIPKFRQVTKNGAYCEVHKKVSLWHQNKEVKSHEILVLLLRLRQICCHPGLISQMIDDMEQANDDEDFDKENIAEKSFNLLEEMEKLKIGHGDTPVCMCSDVFGIFQGNKNSNVLNKSNKVFDLSRASSKMMKVLEVLQDNVLNTNDKAIIVSQWTGVLNIIKPHLAEKGIKYTSLTGSVPVKLREEIVSSFNNPSSETKLMLLSLTAGGVGLNLIGANHLFLVDPHWNPQLEAQAQDRIYRVGQNKPVFIHKFVSRATVEERIKILQDQKLAIANGVLSGVNTAELSKLKLEDLKGLFGLS